jgi:hypothetical protein
MSNSLKAVFVNLAQVGSTEWIIATRGLDSILLSLNICLELPSFIYGLSNFKRSLFGVAFVFRDLISSRMQMIKFTSPCATNASLK